MRRNKAVAKRVLEAVRDLDTAGGVSQLYVFLRCEKAGDSNDDIHSAITLLKTSGYLTEKTNILAMTWSGHDLLESLEAGFVEEMPVATTGR